MAEIFTKFICTVCGHRDAPCVHWQQTEDQKRWKFIEGALQELISLHNQQIIDRENILISEDDLILEKVDQIWDFLHKPQSATLKFSGGSGMPATVNIGGTANSLFQEWTGPNGTGTVVPNAGAISYTSDNPAAATVDPATGVATGVSAGTANITGTDSVNSLTASDVLTVQTPPPPKAVSATLSLTAN